MKKFERQFGTVWKRIGGAQALKLGVTPESIKVIYLRFLDEILGKEIGAAEWLDSTQRIGDIVSHILGLASDESLKPSQQVRTAREAIAGDFLAYAAFKRVHAQL